MSGKMKRLRRTNNPLDRNTRNDINYNWDVLDETLSKIDTADFETDNRFNKIEQELENLDDVDQQLADKIKQNKDTIDALELDLIEEKGNIAEQKGNTAKKQGNKAKEQGDTAEAQGNKAQKQGNTAEAKGKKAEQQGNYAKEQGLYANEKAEYAATLLPNIEGWEFKGEWKSGTKYKKHNIVTHNGSTYILMADSASGSPLQNKSWHMLAQRGVDGKGAVNTINNIAPDIDGNIDLSLVLENLTTVKKANFLHGDEPPTKYPTGIYTFLIAGDRGYPGISGTVVTYKSHEYNYGTYQTFTPRVGVEGFVFYYRFAVNDKWSEWEKIESDVSVGKNLEQHINDEDNPHNVTKEQIGLGNVKNEEQATKQELDHVIKEKIPNIINGMVNNVHARMLGNEQSSGHLHLTDKITDEYKANNGVAITPNAVYTVDQNLQNHKKDEDNPHNVTKEQIGLGNVENVQQASKEELNKHKNEMVEIITDTENRLEKKIGEIENLGGSIIPAIDKEEPKEDYPEGVTAHYVSKNGDYPQNFGTALNIKASDLTMLQLFSENNFSQDRRELYFRQLHDNDPNAEFRRVLTEDDKTELEGVVDEIYNKGSELHNDITWLPHNSHTPDDFPEAYPSGITAFRTNNVGATDWDKLTGSKGNSRYIITTYRDRELRTVAQKIVRMRYNSSTDAPFDAVWYRTAFNLDSAWSDPVKLADNREIDELKKEISDLRNAIIQLGGKL